MRLRDHPCARSRDMPRVPPELVEWSAEHPLPGDRASATGRAALEGRAIHIPDVLAEYGASGHQQAAGHRTTLAAPLLREGTTIGVFGLLRDEGNHSPKSKSHWCRVSLIKPSLPSRTRGCSANYGNHWSDRRRRPTCSKLSAVRPSTCSRWRTS
jgi:hypothetical protein